MKKSPIFLVTLLCMLILCTGVALANDMSGSESNYVDSIMALDYAQGKLTPDQIKFMEDNPSIASKRAEKDAQYLLNKTDQDMNSSMIFHDTINSTASVNVTLGTNATISSCHVGNSGGSKSGIGDWAANYGVSGKWADASTTAFAWGDTSAWSWVGPRISVSGQGSQVADITFNGNYNGSLFGAIGGSSTGRIRVSVWDYTVGSEIAGFTVWNDTSQNGIRKHGIGTINQTVQCTLRSGREYALRFSVGVTSSQYSGTIYSNTDFWNNGAGPEGIDATRVIIRF